MANDEIVLAQLQAAASAADAAAISTRLALAIYQGTATADGDVDPSTAVYVEPDPSDLDDTGCPHLQREDASAMGPDGSDAQKDYCASCRHYVFPDGRAERA